MNFKHFRIIIPVFYLLLMAGSVWQALSLKADYNFEDFLPKNDPELDFYLEFREQFEPDDNFILVGIERSEGIYDTGFLQRVDAFVEAGEQLPFIKQGYSLTNFKQPVMVAGYPAARSVVHLHNQEKLQQDKARIEQDEIIQGRMVSFDGTAIAVVLKSDTLLDLKQSKTLCTALDSLIEVSKFEATHVAGRSYYQTQFVERNQYEFKFYTAISVVLIFIVLFILYRKLATVFIGSITVVVGLTIFAGILGLVGQPINALSTLFPILLIIVGTSDVVHIVSKHLDELKTGKDRVTAIKITLKEIGIATFMTSATTAIGFISLYSANIQPIKDFGVWAAIGVCVAYVSIIPLTAAMLLWFKPHQIARIEKPRDFWQRTLEKWFKLVNAKSKQIVIATIVICGVCVFGLSLVTTNTYLDQHFPRTDKTQTDFRFFEEKMGGVRQIELGLIAKEGHDFSEWEMIQLVEKIEQYVYGMDSVRSIFSPASVYKGMHRAHHGNRIEMYQLPDSETTFKKYQNLLKRIPGNELNVILSKNKQYGRITGKMQDVGSYISFEQKADLLAWVDKNIPADKMDVYYTGITHIVEKNDRYLIGNMLGGLGAAFLIVSLLMALLFKSWKMVIISLIPNIIPMLICGALIGFLSLPLNGPTAIIFAIAFGIAVDDTIHFLAKFKLAKAKGWSNARAVKRTFMETGKAICYTTVILFFGFSLLVTSAYPPSMTIGILVSVTLVTALVFDLSLLPILIFWLMGKEKGGTKKAKQDEA